MTTVEMISVLPAAYLASAVMGGIFRLVIYVDRLIFSKIGA